MNPQGERTSVPSEEVLPGPVFSHLMGWNGVHVHQRTGAAVLLLELRLIGLQHPDLAPAVEEEHDGAHPEHQDEADNEDLLGAHNDLRPCKSSQCECHVSVIPVSLMCLSAGRGFVGFRELFARNAHK